MSETYGKLLHSAIFSVKDLIISPAENLKHKFDKMFYHLSQNDLLDNLQGKIILQVLLLDICMSIKEENKAVSPTVSSAINYIATNITEEMSLEELKEYLRELEEALSKLDAVEPKNENSEAYEDWAEEHEDLEDLIDEVLDLIEDRS